jgi:hypothetical protein
VVGFLAGAGFDAVARGRRSSCSARSVSAGQRAGARTDELGADERRPLIGSENPVLEKHYVPRRSKRTRSVLTLFAEDAAIHALPYANADVSKASQNREVIAFADHWKNLTGHDPGLLVFDSKLTTQAVLAELDDREIGFITLRARHPAITRQLAARPASAWTPMTLGRAKDTTRRVRVHDDPATTLSACPRPIRQLAVTGPGHDQPTLLITNRPALPARQIIQAYARRMNVERRLAEAIQSFGLDALAGAVPSTSTSTSSSPSWPTPSAPHRWPHWRPALARIARRLGRR